MTPSSCPVPDDDALLHRYVARVGSYTDCFEVTLPGAVTLPHLISAFYTTWLFRLERAVLTVALRRRIRDSDAMALAEGRADSFAVWKVEDRDDHQILLCDVAGSTRSFLAAKPLGTGKTQLFFGSAVVARRNGEMSWAVKVLTPLHKFYSKALLQAAARKLR